MGIVHSAFPVDSRSHVTGLPSIHGFCTVEQIVNIKMPRRFWTPPSTKDESLFPLLSRVVRGLVMPVTPDTGDSLG